MSSTGQIIGGIVGAVVGFIVGGPAGALKGAYLGLTVGGLVDPPKGPVIRGPRLDDLSVQTATYGAFIPRLYGTTAIHGNVFWVKGDKLIEIKKVTDSGGKGGPTQTTEAFEYFATFAVGLCEGPILGVRRIWIGNQLWYDAGTSDVNSIVASNQHTAGFQIYTGTETQTADPLIQADKGAANVPAYRGLAYIVFDKLALANYSNSLLGAQVKVEVVKSGATSYILSLQSAAATDINPNYGAISGNYVYVVNGGANTLDIFNVANTLSPFRVSRTGTGSGPNAVAVLDNYAYVVNTFGNSLQKFDVTDPTAPILRGDVATDSTPRFVAAYGKYVFVVTGVGATLQIFSSIGILAPVLLRSVATGLNPRCVTVVGNYVYVVNGGSNTLQIFDITDPAIPLSLSSTTTGANPFSVAVLGNYAYVTNYDGNSLQIFDISNPAIPVSLSSTTTGINPDSVAVLGNYAQVVSASGNSLQVFDISNPAAPVLLGSIATLSSPRSIVISGNYSYVVNGLNSLQIFFFAPGILTPATVALSAIVQSECLKSDLLTAVDLDVTELTDQVRGYRISALGAIRAGLDPVRAAWPFDVVQSGYKIKFKKRGSASVATITAGELDAHAAGEAPGVSITDSREMDLILPYKVSVKYLDTTREYDTNEQYAERLNTDAVNESAIDLPIVFTATEAAGKAETLLYMYWLDRYDVAFKLPPAYAHLEPGDVITINATLATYSLRLTSVQHMPDGRLECQAKYNSASIYTPAAQGSEGLSIGGTLTLAGPTVYQLMDIPMLRDVDNVAGFPVAMTGYLTGWPGGVLFRSEDMGETWTDLVGFVSPGTIMGYATTTLGAHGGTVYDFASTLAVKLYQGTLASVTEAQLFAAQNWFAYGKDGRWEIIAARTATLQTDGSYILRDFLRGQLGTEWASGLHAVNDSFVRLNAATLEFINVNASTIGSERNYRGITAGKALDTDSNRAFTYRGVNLECLSPVHATGDRHPTTNDWTLTWVRRSRFAGWRDLVDATLGETTESYEVDVFSSNTYATLKRTLISATPTVAYTGANQVTDFGANQTTLYLKIYQLSAIVGRGYPLTISLTR